MVQVDGVPEFVVGVAAGVVDEAVVFLGGQVVDPGVGGGLGVVVRGGSSIG